MTTGKIFTGIGFILIIISAIFFWFSVSELNIMWGCIAALLLGVSMPIFMFGMGERNKEYWEAQHPHTLEETQITLEE